MVENTLEKAKVLIETIKKKVIIYTIVLMFYPFSFIMEEMDSFYEKIFYGSLDLITFCFCVLYLFFLFKNLSKITKIEQKLKLDTTCFIEMQDFSDMATLQSKKILTDIIASRMIIYVAIPLAIFGLLSPFWFLLNLDGSNNAILAMFGYASLCFFVLAIVFLFFHFKYFSKFLKIEKNIKAAIQYCYKTQDGTNSNESLEYTKILIRILTSKMIVYLMVDLPPLGLLAIFMKFEMLKPDFFETYALFSIAYILVALLVIVSAIVYLILFFKNLFRIYQIQKNLESDLDI